MAPLKELSSFSWRLREQAFYLPTKGAVEATQGEAGAQPRPHPSSLWDLELLLCPASLACLARKLYKACLFGGHPQKLWLESIGFYCLPSSSPEKKQKPDVISRESQPGIQETI